MNKAGVAYGLMFVILFCRLILTWCGEGRLAAFYCIHSGASWRIASSLEFRSGIGCNCISYVSPHICRSNEEIYTHSRYRYFLFNHRSVLCFILISNVMFRKISPSSSQNPIRIYPY